MPARKPEQTSDTRPTQASESSALTESSAEPAETTTERSDPVSEPPLTTSEPETTAEPPVTTIDLYAMEWTPPEQANADVPLNIRTYDGFDQPCHPKVLYFEEGWNGHRYWMAYTPYPYCADLYENPCLAVSDDGVNWTKPDGVTNPVTGHPPTHENSAHYSDPHILMNGDEMELWFRYNPSYGDGVNADSNEVSRPGPRLVDAAQALYDFVYGEKETEKAA